MSYSFKWIFGMVGNNVVWFAAVVAGFASACSAEEAPQQTGDLPRPAGTACSAEEAPQQTGDLPCPAGTACFRMGASVDPGGGLVSDVVSADCNGDGFDDVLVSGSSPARVRVYRSNGDGTFGTPQTLLIPPGSPRLAAGDLDGDGDIDLVVAGLFSEPVQIHWGSNDCSFPSRTALGSQWATAVVVEDVDGDGRSDVVVGNIDGSIVIHFADGLGGFTATLAGQLTETIGNIAVGDVNGDSLKDLAVSLRLDPLRPIAEQSIQILLGSVKRQYHDPAPTEPSLGPHSVWIADVTGNGLSDLIFTGGMLDNKNTVPSVRVLRGGSDAKWAPLGQWAFQGTFLPGGSMVVADMNADGIADVVVPLEHWGRIAILFGGDHAELGEWITMEVPFAPRLLSSGDYDGDGRIDFIAAALSKHLRPWLAH
ncbi:VCBS repeat-containing protein [Endomicrobium sp. AH-315-J14]|nr:VCBS repeat-containing protein [Endomicrobium sp. AH-315-J14]